MLKPKKIYSLISIAVIFIAVVLVNFSHHKWLRDDVIEFDIKAYYSYLPATFIYDDIKLDFLDDNPRIYDEMWPVDLPNGNKLIVTSYGMSLMYSPFFFLAHAYASLSDVYAADGYSVPYRFAINFSSVAFLILGLFYLRKLLLKYYPDWIVALVLFVIAIGTNLAYFTTYKAAMPHSYNFALITMFAYYTIGWYKKPSRYKAVGIGILFGLIVLIRPTNILVLLFLVLWDVKSFRELYDRVLFYLRRFDYVLVMLLLFLIIWFPQFLYWKTVTGDWIFYSYGAKDASFFWGNPQIFNILFSYKKGWFVYTPVMLIAFIGIFFMLKNRKEAFWPILIFSLINIYVQSCWWCWWFGGGYGIRVFIDSYGLMAIPLAGLLSLASKQKVLRYAIPGILLILTWYNTFQIQQFRHNAIHWWWNNENAYWENFLKKKPTHKYWDLVRLPDYYKARKGEYEAITPLEKNRRGLWRNYRDSYVERLKKNDSIKDSLRVLVKSEEKELDESLYNYAAENVEHILIENKTKIKKRINNTKPWRKFINKQAKELSISYDSSMNIEIKRIVKSKYD